VRLKKKVNELARLMLFKAKEDIRLHNAVVEDLQSLQEQLTVMKNYLEIVEARHEALLNKKGKGK